MAIIQCFEGSLVTAAYFVGLALIFDFFDGFMARLFQVPSPIGKDLDSLADMVTFGVVPGLVVYKLLSISLFGLSTDDINAIDTVSSHTSRHLSFFEIRSLVPYLSFIIPIFSCIRLAKFNNDSRQSHSFIGLPTPSNAIVICSIPLILEFQKPWSRFLLNPWLLCLVSVIMSLLLVAEIPLFALKFQNFGWAGNKLRFSFMALALLLLLAFKFLALPLIILLYILISIVNNIFLKKQV